MTKVATHPLNFYVVIPAHNEAEFIGKTLDSLINQSLRPKKIMVVDDHSTDSTSDIVAGYCQEHDFIDLIQKESTSEHLPGGKIVRAFYKGLNEMNGEYDIICKFDADLIFPSNYLEELSNAYSSNPSLGMAGGFCTIEKDGEWVLEDLTDKSHIRGALKSYRKECFIEIGGLKEAMGWDTLDELLATYYDWEVQTFEYLLVKHLRPTGASYEDTAKEVSGEALYRMHYGTLISFITSFKMAWLKKDPVVLSDNMKGYFKAKKNKENFLVSDEEGKWIRNYRWKKMFDKLF